VGQRNDGSIRAESADPELRSTFIFELRDKRM
jgi:hypothetical protein